MPIARVQLPDGRIARIEVPEDATQDQIESFASQHFGSFDDEPENDLYTPPQAVEPEKELEVVEPKNVGTLENIAREVSAGAVSGVGYGAQGFGSMFEKGGEQLAKGLNWTFDTDFFRSDNVLSGAADAVNKYSKEVEAGTSQDWREAKQGSSPTGDISDPSTWNWGEDPSLKGYAAQVLNVFGQAGPMAALAVATRGQSVVQQMTGMGTVGAAVTIGAGEKEISEEIEGMSHADLLKASELYKDRVSIGDTPEEAKLKVVDTISDDAFWKLAAIGGVGGLATGYVLGGLASKAGAGLAAKAAAEGVGEGTEELLEGIAKNDSFGAAGIKKDLMEGSLGNFVLGALGGATTSVATSPFDSDPTKKIAKALEAEVDASGYAVPASEVARQQFDPSREAASITAQLDRAQSVEEVIDIASSNIELDIATPAATIPGIDLGDQGQEYAQDIAPLQDITEAPAFTPEQGIEQLEGAGRNLLTEQLEPSTIPTDAPIEEITPTLPVEPEDRYAKDYEDIAAAKEQEGWTTEPKQPKSKGAQIPVGEPVTLKHRSPQKFDQLDDTKFGKQLGAPTSQLGHFMGVDDIGKPEIYGENIKDFEVTIKKPAYMDFDTYQSLDEKTDAEVKQIRQDFIDEGYDAVIIEDLGHVAVLSGKSAQIPTNVPRIPTNVPKAPVTAQERFAKVTKVDESKDSLLTASSKLGGLNIEAWEAEGIDPEVMKDRKMNNKVFGKPAFRRKGGMTPDDLAEIANQYGYGQDLTANDVLDLVTQELGGDPIYTPDGVVAKAERDLVQQQEDAIMQELDYNPTEYEFLTEGMDAEQEALFHASVSMDIDPDQYPDQETLQAGVTESYDNYARTVAEEDQAGQEFALKQETEAQRQQREAAETEQALTAKTAEDAAQAKAQADKEVGEFTLTGSNRVADIAASQGQQDIFGAKPEKKEVPLKDIKISEEAITPDGDTVAITRTADNVIKDIDSRIDGLKLLKGCIGG